MGGIEVAKKNKGLVSKIGPSGADFTTDSTSNPKKSAGDKTMDEWSKSRGTETIVTKKDKRKV